MLPHCRCRLTAEERSRNIPGDMLVFEYAAGRHEPEHCASDLPQHFASVAMVHSICRHVPVSGAMPPVGCFVCGYNKSSCRPISYWYPVLPWVLLCMRGVVVLL
jgi:hypothetical protein